MVLMSVDRVVLSPLQHVSDEQELAELSQGDSTGYLFLRCTGHRDNHSSESVEGAQVFFPEETVYGD